MASYDVQTPDGASYTIEAADENQLNSAVNDLMKPPDKTWTEFGNNAIQGAKKAVSGTVDLAKGLATHPIDTISDIPSGIISEGKRIGLDELLGSGKPGESIDPHPIKAAEKFGSAFYNDPVATGMDVAALFGIGKGGVADAVEASIPEAATKIPEALEPAKAVPPAMEAEAPKPTAPISLPSEEADILKNIKPSESPKIEQPAPSPSLGIPQMADNALGKANDLKNYISHSYENVAKKPGIPADIADYLQGKSQMFAARDVGITPLQARQLGHEGTRAVGQYAIENGYQDATRGLEGKRALNSQLLNKAGSTLDSIRSEADKTGKVYQPGELLNSVKSQLDQKYLRGVTPDNPSAKGIHGSQAGEYQRALQEIEDFDNTHVGAANIATELNKFANKASKLKQPTGAYTDVANAISRINNDRIQQLVPQKAPAYEQALREYGVNKKISSGLERKSAGEVKREGPGSLTNNLFQKALDEAGYRVGSKSTNKVATAIKSNPGIAKSLPSLFKEFIHHVEEEGNEIGQ